MRCRAGYIECQGVRLGEGESVKDRVPRTQNGRCSVEPHRPEYASISERPPGYANQNRMPSVTGMKLVRSGLVCTAKYRASAKIDALNTFSASPSPPL